MDRAATVVLDFFDGVPVTVRQSPTVTALRVSVAVSENVVLAVQLTDVCPSVGALHLHRGPGNRCHAAAGPGAGRRRGGVSAGGHAEDDA